MKPSIRAVADGDMDAVLVLNESAVPAVNSLERADLEWFADQAAYFRVVDDERGIAAFLIGLRAGTGYASPNYRWFSDRYSDFAYVDRIVVDKRARQAGLASALYQDFADRMRPVVDVMTCEVNLVPPNPVSMRFHERRGFRQVGSQATEGGSKQVAMLELRL